MRGVKRIIGNCNTFQIRAMIDAFFFLAQISIEKRQEYSEFFLTRSEKDGLTAVSEHLVALVTKDLRN